MNRSILVGSIVTVLGLGAAPALAQYDESRIRTASSSTQVEGRVGQTLFFTVTGYLSDTASIQNCFGSNTLIGSISNLRWHPYVYEVVYHSGGQASLRFCVPSAGAVLNGGTVTVQRGATLIDRDRIVLR